MNILFFIVLPLATILIAIVLQKVLRSPILVAILTFAIYFILAFTVFTTEFLLNTIIYTIIAFLTAVITEAIFCHQTDTNTCDTYSENSIQMSIQSMQENINQLTEMLSNILRNNNGCNRRIR